jgi:hypothetical protein
VAKYGARPTRHSLGVRPSPRERVHHPANGGFGSVRQMRRYESGYAAHNVEELTETLGFIVRNQLRLLQEVIVNFLHAAGRGL